MSYQSDNGILVCTIGAYKVYPPSFSWITDSAKYFGIDLTVLLPGEPCIDNFDLKIVRFRNEIKSRFMHYQTILFSDGLDSLFTCGIEEIHKRWLLMAKPFVISGNNKCWPLSSYASKFPESPTSQRYICSGGFIADSKALMAVLDVLVEKKRLWDGQIEEIGFGRHVYTCDQAALCCAYANKEIDLSIDYRCELFLQMPRDRRKRCNYFENRNLLFENGTIKYLETGCYPTILHGKYLEGVKNYVCH
jgi:hypothetical protein